MTTETEGYDLDCKHEPTDFKYDFGGHFRSQIGTGPLSFDELPKFTKIYAEHIVKRDVLFMMLRRNSKLRGSDISDRLPINGECPECGTRFELQLDGKVLTVKPGHECKYPGGYPEYFVEINVPSGKLVFGNDFRDLVTLICDDDSHYVNYTSEVARCTRDYADVGMVHIMVGNTCPGVHRKNGQILIGSFARDEEGEKIEDPDREDLGGICTDLWWFSAMDYDHYLRAVQENEQEDETKSDHWARPFIVDVEPGRYRFSGRYNLVRHEIDDRWGEEEIFSIGERIGDCVEQPIEDTSSGDDFLDSKFWKSWLRARTKYRSLYPSMTHWVGHIYCTLGGGYHWHDGVLRESGSEDTPWAANEQVPGLSIMMPTLNDPKIQDFIDSEYYHSIPIWPAEAITNYVTPVLMATWQRRMVNSDYRRRVYPMSDHYGICRMPANPDKYFLAAALMFFKAMWENQEMLTRGEDTRVGSDRYGYDANGKWVKVGFYDAESLKELQSKILNEQIDITRKSLNLMITIAVLGNRFETDLPLAFSKLTEDDVVQDMIALTSVEEDE